MKLDTASALFIPSLERDRVQELPKAISEVVLYYNNKDELAVNITYFPLSILVRPQVSSEDVSNANFYQKPISMSFSLKVVFHFD